MQTTEYRGPKYQAHRDVKDVAKDIRKDIKQTVKDGYLPGDPVKYSVTIERFSGGRAINVTIKNWPTPARRWVADLRGTYGGGYERTHEAQSAMVLLESIVDAYNRDNSDTMTDYFDVAFYSSIDFDFATTPRPEGAR